MRHDQSTEPILPDRYLSVRLHARLAVEGFEARTVEPLSPSAAPAVFRIELTDGRRVKLRLFPSPEKANIVWRVLRTRNATLPQPLALIGRALVVEYVDGVPLDQYLRTAAADEHVRLVRTTGRLLARLHAGPRPRMAAPVFIQSRWLLSRIVGKLVRGHWIDRRSARRLTAIAIPKGGPIAVSHGDPAPVNLVLTTRARLRLIDEDRLAVRPVAFDVARTVTRWPLTPSLEEELVTGYARAGGDAGSFVEHRAFWIASALATSGAFRLKYHRRDVPAIARALAALAATLD